MRQLPANPMEPVDFGPLSHANRWPHRMPMLCTWCATPTLPLRDGFRCCPRCDTVRPVVALP